MSLACEIKLYVSGEDAGIEAFHAAFVRANGEPGFTDQLVTNFAAFIPEADPTADDEARSDWARENWGPRWEGWDVKVEDLPQGVRGYSFWVKDGEPSLVVEAASARFPGLTFEYWYEFEDGSDRDSRTYAGGVGRND